MSIEFLLTSLLIVATPGTGALLSIAAGLAHGPRAGIIAAVGNTLGVFPHMIAALTGLAALLHASAVAFETVKYLGVAYLLYMAWQMIRGAGSLSLDGTKAPSSTLAMMRDGILLNLLNPKLSIFFVAFLPLFVRPDDLGPLRAMIGLSLVFALVTFGVFAVYGIFAGLMRRHVLERPAIIKWMTRGFAAAFAGLAVKLATTDR